MVCSHAEDTAPSPTRVHGSDRAARRFIGPALGEDLLRQQCFQVCSSISTDGRVVGGDEFVQLLHVAAIEQVSGLRVLLHPVQALLDQFRLGIESDGHVPQPGYLVVPKLRAGNVARHVQPAREYGPSKLGQEMAREAARAVKHLGCPDDAARGGQEIGVVAVHLLGNGDRGYGRVGLDREAVGILVEQALEDARDQPVGPEGATLGSESAMDGV